jgi:hypothetical protein
MVSSTSRTLASFAALLSAVAGGFLTGIVVDVGISVLAGVGCLIGGVWQRKPESKSDLIGPIACVASVAYVFVLIVMNPLELVISEADIARSIMLLAPLALGAFLLRCFCCYGVQRVSSLVWYRGLCVPNGVSRRPEPAAEAARPILLVWQVQTI